MTDLFQPVDTADPDLASGARGLLGVFNVAGFLTSADVHVALALGLVGGETDETVLLAAALACRAVRAGSVCLALADLDRAAAPDLPWPEDAAWAAAVAASPLVAAGVLRWEAGGLLYLDRYHEQETQVLDEAMAQSDYPLQALLYTVVLHRFLRWRLPSYDPTTHLGGVLYLYLRGMCGPGTPVVDGQPCGVFSWRPPVALVESLSDLLDGVSP